ncbi:hypothetical protein NBO_2g0043 [Nosema bombycis CQ1]|uniref:Uncharacterized protein n=1 Tax=Nosema bombycis (strain CQ1 / CVCC 102059) TaxID=578461 RepID=R0KXC5_NOSB1|nr:hypothetical protein NBO_2g0043 [Nosema bombycis CQ1]|eukprot:EOB15551.1 hypothetical protein NBO_2g0043 [Nosema bombycis CQ1]
MFSVCKNISGCNVLMLGSISEKFKRSISSVFKDSMVSKDVEFSVLNLCEYELTVDVKLSSITLAKV